MQSFSSICFFLSVKGAFLRPQLTCLGKSNGSVYDKVTKVDDELPKELLT